MYHVASLDLACEDIIALLTHSNSFVLDYRSHFVVCNGFAYGEVSALLQIES